MSDKPISVGDLVVVVRPSPCRCAKRDAFIGAIFKVLQLARTVAKCHSCGTELAAEYFAWSEFGAPGHGAAVWRLKRLDPDALKDDVPTREELTA